MEMAYHFASYSKQSPLFLSALVFQFLSLCYLVTSLPINDTGILSLPGRLGATRPSCAELARYPEWYQPSQKFDNGDCKMAIQTFYNDYVRNHEGTRYEYYNDPYSPIHGIPTQKVPLKFASGELKSSSRQPVQ